MKITLALPLLVLLTACHADRKPPAGAASRVDIAVTSKGFEPANVEVPAGEPVTLVFHRKTDRTCAKEIVIPMPDGTRIEKELPLDTPVEVAATFSKAGTVTYSCSMDMVKATITVD